MASQLPPAVRAHLGRELRSFYSLFAEEVLPERFAALIEQLERAFSAKQPVEPWFREGVLKAVPRLRVFAISLSGNPDRADDLVQDTIMRAFDKRDSFQPGTNLQAWLFTILRNSFLSQYRKRSREVEDVDGIYAGTLRSIPDQIDKLHLQDLQAALAKLPAEQREAVLLVGAEGLSYEETAAICGCALGTIKSRVNRARTRLAELLAIRKDDLDADGVLQAALIAD